MRIAIDGRSLLEPRWGGVSWYTFYLLAHLLEHPAAKNHELRLYVNSRHLDLKPAVQALNLVQRRYYCPNRFINLMSKFLNAPQIDVLTFPQGDCDLLWLPNWTSACYRRQTAMILTAHDLSITHLASVYNLKARFWHQWITPKRLCQAADHILAVSNWTKQDLVATYNIPPEKITVIYEGVSFDPAWLNTPGLTQKWSHLPSQYLLAFDGPKRKNIDTIIRALELLDWPWPLVLIGSQRSGPGIISCSYVTTPEKFYLLHHAQALIFSSFFEGFGLPVLEAMAVGCPVIASNVTSLPEILGNTGVLVSPYNIGDWAAAIQAVCEDISWRQELSTAGQARAQTFSWQKSSDDWWKSIHKLF